MKKNGNTIYDTLEKMEMKVKRSAPLAIRTITKILNGCAEEIRSAEVPVFILTKVKNYTSDNEEQIVWSGAYPTKKAAIKAMREEMFGDLDAAYEGLDEETDGEDIPDFKALVKEAMAIARKTKYYDVPLSFSDCEAVYNIFQSSIKIG